MYSGIRRVVELVRDRTPAAAFTLINQTVLDRNYETMHKLHLVGRDGTPVLSPV